MVQKSRALLRAQALAAFSYPIELSLSITNIALTLAAFYLISQYAFGSSAIHRTSSREYFGFVAIGILVSRSLSTWLSAFSARIRELQTSGALEMLLACRTSPIRIVIGTTLYDLLLAAFEFVVGLALALFLFGLGFQSTAWPQFLLSLSLALATYGGIGLMSAAFVLLYKKGNPVLLAFDQASTLVGGVYFPVTVMPPCLAKIANCLPLKHVLDVTRLTVSTSSAASKVLLHELAIVTGFAAASVLGGILALNATMRRVLSRGTVAHY